MTPAVVDCRVVADGGLDERYVAGLLTGEEREAFELHYMGCATCFERVTWMEAARDRLSSPSHTQRGSGVAFRARWWFVPAAAASVALAVVWATRRDATDPTSPASVVAPAPSVASTPVPAPRDPVGRATDNDLAALVRFEPPAYRASALRSSEDAAARRFRGAMSAYERGEYREVIPQLTPVAAQRVDASFFQAACYLLVGDARAAVDAATRTLAFGDTPYVEETRLLMAKAWLTLGDRQRAIDALDAVIDMRGEFLTEARGLRDRLSTVATPP